MAIENDGDAVGDRPADKASVQPPGQSPRNENAPSPSADDNSKQNISAAKELQKIEAGERWLIGIGVATILINAVIAYIYYGQLQQMRIATEASTKAATLVADALDENGGQFDRTVRQLIYQTVSQAEAAQAGTRAAHAAKSAADTAKQTLLVSERAYLKLEDPTIDVQAKSVTVPVLNTGQLPSGEAIATLHRATYIVANLGDRMVWDQPADKSWQRMHWSSVAQGNHNSVILPFPLLDEKQLTVG